ncbi:tapasin-related protein-like [Platysternon megacephalum]|uniref:Tapasin-related protein-like n=1 Tax=Platysternon megacephalum TaxID=55544 RepID=A0A4D9DJM1_9SAUR|nr:tapasin-related protein-like [Platysternon megacephalum]
MKETIRPFDDLYNPPSRTILAARPLNVSGKYTEHSEWRLLSGPNSHVAQLKARTCRPKCCLILFTLNLPCTNVCLAKNGPFNIMQMTSDAFSDIAKKYKAFVFQRIFVNDTWPVVTRKELLQAWHRLHNVTLLCCDNNGCQKCTSVYPENNPFLAGKR